MVLPGFWDSIKGTYGQKPKDGGVREDLGAALGLQALFRWVIRVLPNPSNAQ
jgi:hypothetical protein